MNENLNQIYNELFKRENEEIAYLISKEPRINIKKGITIVSA